MFALRIRPMINPSSQAETMQQIARLQGRILDFTNASARAGLFRTETGQKLGGRAKKPVFHDTYQMNGT